MPTETLLPTLLLVAWLAPLASFAVSAVAGTVLARRPGGVDGVSARAIGQVATGAVVVSLLASLGALGVWVAEHPPAGSHGEHAAHHVAHSATHDTTHDTTHNAAHNAAHYAGEWFSFLEVGPLRLAAGYYVDSLTIVMAVVVTLVATCVHFYAFGYLAEETDADGPDAVTDKEAATYYGEPVRRAGRLHRFYQHLSLFCFAMLGIVVAGNVAMTFVFWELVGASSYLLIGFYYERPAAGEAATKAMLFNRVGDVGMLVGLMALWGLAGTLDYASLFAAAPGWLSALGGDYWLVTLAGAGLFAGCVGKSAQVPLQAWLPDAMAGPTPVSALVHSATMVAAGVFLVGRIYPLLTVEVLLVIASIGGATLLLGAVLATAANDLKRVLAYSTVSQLGYMMLALGLGGWAAGLFHLVTHAGFKALLFLGAGSVIHAVHTNDLRAMGGLRRAMPSTALLMLLGVLAIVGAGIPGLGIGLSGFFSKDAILEHAIAFARTNPAYGWLFWAPAIGSVLTAAYMVRLWMLVFVGPPRSADAEHAHEAPASMLLPMAVVAAMAVTAGWFVPGTGLSVPAVLETSAPESTHTSLTGLRWTGVTLPSLDEAHATKTVAGITAIAATILGAIVSLVLHSGGRLFTTPVGAAVRTLDLRWIPSVSRGLGAATLSVGGWIAGGLDRLVIDGGLAQGATAVRGVGGLLRRLQTGNLRQYIGFLAVGVVVVGTASLGLALYWMRAS